MGTALAVRSSLAAHSSLPVFDSNARKRLSVAAPMNTRPDAVAMGPALPAPPVLRLPSGSASDVPRVVCHAISPVLALTAVRRLHGGFWQGKVAMVRPLWSLMGAL